MKKDTGILLAGGMGVIVGLGIYGLRWFLSKKHIKYQEHYADYHRNFESRYSDIDHHGVEFLAMQ